MSSRSYDDACGAALAMDNLGERWALLVVRELLPGPKRYTDLRAGLPAVGTNVLSQRLRELEGSGVVERIRLGPPVSVPAYRLTRRGFRLERVLLELARWGGDLTSRPEQGMSSAAFVLLLRVLYNPPADAALPVSARLVIGQEAFLITASDVGLRIDAIVDSSGGTGLALSGSLLPLWDLFRRFTTLERSLESGGVTVDGDVVRAQELLDLFPGAEDSLA